MKRWMMTLNQIEMTLETNCIRLIEYRKYKEAANQFKRDGEDRDIYIILDHLQI